VVFSEAKPSTSYGTDAKRLDMTGIRQIPDRLFHYRKVDIYTSDIFCRQKLWFSCPRSLNDPFDCQPIYTVDSSEAEFRQYLHERLRSDPEYCDLPANKFDEVIDQHVQDEYPPQEAQKNEYIKQNRDRVNSVGIFCACERFDSVVMWSHYASKHQGVCIEIDPAKLPENICFHQVKYHCERPIINLIRDWQHANKMAVSIKNDEWSYEDEWRITIESTNQSPSLPCAVDLPTGLITGVILGARMPDPAAVRVREWCQFLAPSPTIYRARLNEKKYLIDRVLDDE